MIEMGYEFKQAVYILEKWLRQHKTALSVCVARRQATTGNKRTIHADLIEK